MKHTFRSIFTAALFAMSCPAMLALDLPVKSINGKQYYYYAVRRGDTLLDVARRIGVSRDDIVKYNTSAADVLRQGTTLYLPVDEFKDVQTPKHISDERPDAPGRTSRPFAYKVERGETLFGICHRFGVSTESVIALNPEANQGIKAGQIITIPAGARLDSRLSATASDATEEESDSQETHRHEPAPVAYVTRADDVQTVSAETPAEDSELEEAGPAATDPDVRALRPVPGPSVAVDPDEAADTVRATVALMLPLMLDGDQHAKPARSATEFVKGFMLALDERRESAWPMDLYIYDTAGRPDTVPTLLSRPECESFDLIVSPDDAATFSAIVRAADSGLDTYLLNLMAVQDTSYMTDSRVMQYNVPHNIMYADAAESLMSTFDGYTPVFLISKGGKSEKLPFTDYLRSQFAEIGVEPVDMVFEGMLSAQDLEGLSPESRYVFIPASGSLTEFNKFARPLITLKENSADPSQIAVFGYPDWTIFRNDALENLHKLGAVIYSRFYADANDPKVRIFAEKFTDTYGAPMIEQVPSQAMLGYDTGCYVLANISANKGMFDAEWSEPYRGLQSTFMFTDAESDHLIDGTANSAVYIITFLPGDEVSVQVL